MKTWFAKSGWRNTKSWSCSDCNNFDTFGMDLAVDKSIAKHQSECPARKQENKMGKEREIELKNLIERFVHVSNLQLRISFSIDPELVFKWHVENLERDAKEKKQQTEVDRRVEAALKKLVKPEALVQPEKTDGQDFK